MKIIQLVIVSIITISSFAFGDQTLNVPGCRTGGYSCRPTTVTYHYGKTEVNGVQYQTGNGQGSWACCPHANAMKEYLCGQGIESAGVAMACTNN